MTRPAASGVQRRPVSGQWGERMIDRLVSWGQSLRAALTQPATTARVDPAARYQTLEGWGTSLAWWAHIVGGWSERAHDEIADLVFNPVNGLGLTVARYNIGGGDDPTHHHMRPGGDVPGFQSSPDTWDWTADARQRRVLLAARERGANIFEAFSNSPPYWMTRSGCAAGADDGGDNLRDDHIDAFAAYLAAVAAHYRDEWGITFRTVEPFNEPAASNWRKGNRQEGCHVSPARQRAVVARLAEQLAARGLTATAISAPDDYSIDQAVETLRAYDSRDLTAIAQVNVHSYSGTRRADLRELAAAHGKPLWMSEYGNGAGHHDHAAMEPALLLSAQIRRDLTELRPAAWVYWQAVEAEGGHDSNWGFIHADFSGASEQYWLTKQYYAMAQYSRFIRPGFEIIAIDDPRALAAHDLTSGTLAIVYDNDTAAEIRVAVDLSRFNRCGGAATAYRTSPAESMARLPDVPLDDKRITAVLPPQSISTFVVTCA